MKLGGFTCILVLLVAAQADAVVWRADLDAAPGAEPVAVMRQVVRVHYTKLRVFGGCGLQLSDSWVLVARHGVEIWKARTLQVRIGADRCGVKRVVLHPDAKVDLALIELQMPIPMRERITLSAGEPGKGSRLWLGGFGKRGPAGDAGRSGIFAAGFNRLEVVANKRGKMVFDRPGQGADPGESLPARFDSGSPVFVQQGKAWHLLGITVTASNSKNPNYGDRSHHQLVAPERKWLDAHVLGLKWAG